MTEPSRLMPVEDWPIEKLKPYLRNPRHNAEAVDTVALSLQAYGWEQNIVVDEAGVVVVGHTRLMAAKKLGMTHVPVKVMVASPAEIRAYRLMDNASGEKATWDFLVRRMELQDLVAENFDLTLTGLPQQVLDDALHVTGSVINPASEWQGMPEYEHKDKRAFQTITVHFKDAEAVEAFARTHNRNITPETHYLWFPEIEVERAHDKRYAAEP